MHNLPSWRRVYKPHLITLYTCHSLLARPKTRVPNSFFKHNSHSKPRLAKTTYSQKGSHFSNGLPIKELIPFTLWHLWNVRNKNCFECANQKPSISTILQLTNEYHFLTNHSTKNCNKFPMYVKWNLPPYRVLQLNTDGAASQTKPIADFGGVFRDHTGNWIMGYAGHHPFTNFINIELMALLRGLQIAIMHNLTPLEIQMDAQEEINMLQNNALLDSPLLIDCRFLIHQLSKPAQ